MANAIARATASGSIVMARNERIASAASASVMWSASSEVVVPGLMVFSAVFYLSVLFTFNDSFGGSPPRDADEPPPPEA